MSRFLQLAAEDAQKIDWNKMVDYLYLTVFVCGALYIKSLG